MIFRLFPNNPNGQWPVSSGSLSVSRNIYSKPPSPPAQPAAATLSIALGTSSTEVLVSIDFDGRTLSSSIWLHSSPSGIRSISNSIEFFDDVCCRSPEASQGEEAPSPKCYQGEEA